ncbi:hypothetical protein ATO12_01070 [Aquimarina atlantica]|uniref:Uncharacterized protein n=1 Tax=Aquimarina atlantica TaxID=1317122 RepID=A0A023BZL1_9FLAO|nr:hypothetical protein [Aquimarina atlantica]EZH75399.1 hypothetical protein ATO12_01070 [Aquimarina atlantica]
MKSTLGKFKKFEIEKSKLKDIKGESWVCSMTDIKGSAFVTKHSQVKAFLARGYHCEQPRVKLMNVL